MQWLVGRVFQTEGTTCEKAKRKRDHGRDGLFIPLAVHLLGLSPVPGTEGFKRNGDLLSSGKSLSISMKNLGLETNWKYVSKCYDGSCCSLVAKSDPTGPHMPGSSVLC